VRRFMALLPESASGHKVQGAPAFARDRKSTGRVQRTDSVHEHFVILSASGFRAKRVEISNIQHRHVVNSTFGVEFSIFSQIAMRYAHFALLSSIIFYLLSCSR